MFTRIVGLLIFCFMPLIGLNVWADTAPSNASSQVIYLVRHGEKQQGPDAGRDPQLAEAGKARAEQLARILEGVEIDAVFSTDFIRTKETARPLAEQRGLPIQSYDYRKLKEFATELEQAGDRILVVGHSNTTPEIVALLGGEQGTPIRESDEYDRLYIVIRDRSQVTTLLQRYGEDSREHKIAEHSEVQ
ncbi:SixA phosphatase family protein [Microbulbifer variabilis]|uniref:SixA phosphatase family protein n=1 Tax=Microbulbifer variabilis TaxID=266805 RepID=UPI001CFF0BCD|nr:phosphoglycerate mutase family protein [Microbulbifer variabilis]